MDRLAEIQARLDAAMPDGPEWVYDDPNMIVWDSADEDAEQVAQGVGTADGLLISNAPTDLAYLLERVWLWRQLAEDAMEYLIELRGEKGLAFTDQWASDLEARCAALTEGGSNE